jgi:hypothetical protein
MMNRTLNTGFIKQYKTVFAEQLVAQAFRNKEQVTGKDILNLSSIKQLNFFILKILFNKWQEEMKRLESPYFDFKDPNVRKAMVSFMNVLSQYIKVGKKEIKPLIEKALTDTLQITIDPVAFLAAEFADKSIITDKSVSQLSKYIFIHKLQITEFLNEHIDEDFSELAIDAPLVVLNELIEKELSELVLQLSSVLIVSSSDLIQQIRKDTKIQLEIENEVKLIEEEIQIEEEEELLPLNEEKLMDDIIPAEQLVQTENSYIRDLSNENKEDFIDKPEEEDFNEEEEYPDDEETDDEADDELIEEEETDDEADDELIEEEEIKPITKDSTVDIEDEQQGTLNQKYEITAKTLADIHEEKKVTNIMEAISINHRYMFLQELFDGDNEAFQQALLSIERSNSFDQAVEKLIQTYAKDFYWDMNSDEVKELLKVVFRRFRD